SASLTRGHRPPGAGVARGAAARAPAPVWPRRALVQAVENSCSPGVHGHAGERGEPEQAGEAAAAEREQQDEIWRVIEREAEPELVVPAVLVEESGNGHQRDGQPERAMKARFLLRPEQVEKERSSDEEA